MVDCLCHGNNEIHWTKMNLLKYAKLARKLKFLRSKREKGRTETSENKNKKIFRLDKAMCPTPG